MSTRKPIPRPGAGVQKDVSNWLCQQGFKSHEAKHVVGELQGFAHATSRATQASIGLLAGVGKYGHQHLWVNVTWPGLDLNRLDKPNQTKVVKELFSAQFGKPQPRGLTVHLEYVDQDHQGSLERHLRERAAEEGRTFLVVYADPHVKVASA